VKALIDKDRPTSILGEACIEFMKRMKGDDIIGEGEAQLRDIG
jgi:hypothetical protein